MSADGEETITVNEAHAAWTDGLQPRASVHVAFCGELAAVNEAARRYRRLIESHVAERVGVHCLDVTITVTTAMVKR